MGEWHHGLDGQEFDGQIDPLESKQKATALHELTSQPSVTCLLLVASIELTSTISHLPPFGCFHWFPTNYFSGLLQNTVTPAPHSQFTEAYSVFKIF